jgi:hypothetical protein
LGQKGHFWSGAWREREREKESYCEDRWLMDVKWQEVDAHYDMWVFPQLHI